MFQRRQGTDGPASLILNMLELSLRDTYSRVINMDLKGVLFGMTAHSPCWNYDFPIMIYLLKTVPGLILGAIPCEFWGQSASLALRADVLQFVACSMFRMVLVLQSL